MLGKRGAVVMLNPQTGEILAMASAPSFDPGDVDNDVKWQEIWNDAGANHCSTARSMNTTCPARLSALTAAARIESRMDDKTYTCRAEGWTPPSNRPIRDDEGESHGSLGLLEAYTRSCNQYFAQLGVEVERQRMGEATSRFGLRVYDTGMSRSAWARFTTSEYRQQVLSDVLPSLISTFVAGRKTTRYDLALESIGQGYVQLTPMQMAMIAAAAANSRGRRCAPRSKWDASPSLSQAMSPDTAAKMRALMASVVERGTAAGTFGTMVRRTGLTAEEDRTAQRDVDDRSEPASLSLTSIRAGGPGSRWKREAGSIPGSSASRRSRTQDRLGRRSRRRGYGARTSADRGQSAGESEGPRIIERRSGSAEAHAGAQSHGRG